MKFELHQLMQDNDCHWYVVPVADKELFEDMMECEWDEITEAGFKLLEKWGVDSPASVEFMWPIEKI